MQPPTVPVVSVDRQITAAAKQAGGFFRTRYGLWLLGMISFVESALVVPIITDPFLVVYLLSNQGRLWAGVVVTTLASAAGGIVAYATAVAAFDYVAARFFSESGLVEFNTIAAQLDAGTFLITLLGAVTPIPYTLVALAAGFVQANFVVFVLATLLGRGFRYGVVGYITARYGQQALSLIRPYVTYLSVVLVVLGLVYLLWRW